MKTVRTKTCSSITADSKNRPAAALVLTLIVLTILTAITYTLASRIGFIRHRQLYLIDYQQARYACDSAIKYALDTMKTVNLKLADRSDEPDFSEVFTMDQSEYQQYLTDWAEYKTQQQLEDSDSFEMTGQNPLFAAIPTDIVNYAAQDPNELEIPGPYGPAWPHIVEPIEFEVGLAHVRIEIMDENAKMPLIWSITSDKKVTRAAKDATQLFCEWMQMEPLQIEDFQDRLEQVAEQKQFSINPKPITVTKRVQRRRQTTKTTSRSSRLRRRKQLNTPTTVKRKRPVLANTADFARLLHSSLIDPEVLARAVPDTGSRYESPLKYLGLWGSQRVNINTAPRHVLEAAFTFGGNHTEIADEIIKLRRVKPFKDINDLKEKLDGYSEEIRKCEPYITTTSMFFVIRVTADCGSAKTSAVAAVIKNGAVIQKIAVMAN